MDSTRLMKLGDRLLDASIKALPLSCDDTVRADEISKRGWNVRDGDLDFPVLVLKERELAHNIEVMADYCREHRVSLAPHGKTTMAPQLFERQITAGAWGITAATISHCRTYRAFGVQRILLANVLVDPVGVRWAVDQLASDESFEFLCYVDSTRGIELIEEALQQRSDIARLPVLVELGYIGGRTGCRTHEEAMEVARRASASPSLDLRGVAGFEGLIPAVTLDEVTSRAGDFLAEMQRLVSNLHASGAFSPDRDVVVSAGGSAYFDLVVSALSPDAFPFPVHTILRSGCYVTHDAEMYELTSALAARTSSPGQRLHAALELWATVWSRPEPGLAIVGLGKRDTPYDYRLPLPQTVWQQDRAQQRDVRGTYEITALNDQHAFMRIPADDPLQVGDQVVLGISHPCGAFDKWSFIPVVDDDYVVVDGVSTLF